ncbi:ion transporter [Chloroflexi bacterium TSY]|nr:ion transporter [Chloroflexi bacterium TSY]
MTQLSNTDVFTQGTPAWQRRLDQVVHSTLFNNFIIAVIIAAGVLVGIDTYDDFAERNRSILFFFERIILGIFIVEIILKMGAEGLKPWRYFNNPWNVFDFTIVAASLLPLGTSFLPVLRLLRIFRVFKLVTALPKLQMIVGALIRSIPAMGYVSVLLLLLFYIYAVIAVITFGANDPVHFGDLQIAMISLFRAVTLEDWTDLMYINMYGCAQYGYDGMMERCTQSYAMPITGAAFFISFIMTGALITLNFFIGVVISSMDEVRGEAETEEWLEKRVEEGYVPEQELLALNQKLQDIQESIQMVAMTIERGDRQTLKPDSPSLQASDAVQHRRTKNDVESEIDQVIDMEIQY